MNSMSEATLPQLSVIIATYNNRRILQECLARWETFAGDQPIEIIVVADGCTDGTHEFLALHSESAWGRAKLRWVTEPNVHELQCTNRGFREARGPLVMSWHDDMHLQSSALVPELIETFSAYPEIGLTSLSRGLNCSPSPRPARWEELFAWSRVQSTIGQVGWNWFCLTEVDAVMRPWVVRKSCVDRVGPLDSAFKLSEWDEADFCYRIREAGWRIATHGYERLGYYRHLLSSTIGRTMSDAYKAQVLANAQLFHDRWNATIVRESNRSRKTWLRCASASTWPMTLRRAIGLLFKSKGLADHAAGVAP